MRWDRLFADLEARFDDIADEQATAERADRERVAVGAVRAIQRLSGAVGQPVTLHLAGGATIGGRLRTVGPDWLLLAESNGRDALVALSAVTAVQGLTTATGQEPTGFSVRIDLRRALRGLARDRSPVAVGLPGWSGGAEGGQSGGYGSTGSAEITGTIDRVGADFIEIAVHAAWEPRRPNAVRSVVMVPLGAVVMVRAVPAG